MVSFDRLIINSFKSFGTVLFIDREVLFGWIIIVGRNTLVVLN